jgi:hypothetical protein
MIHMELPPNKDVDCYEQFYLDWDSFYNKEPFYKSFRDLDLLSAVGEAGFRHEEFFTYVIPSIHNCGLESNNVAAGSDDPSLQGNVGKLQEGLKWFTFGAWKR